MKIWLINQYAVPPTRPGGTRHYSLAKQWINAGAEVQLISGTFNHFDHKQYPVIQDELFQWIETAPYKGSGLSRILGMIAYSKQIWNLRDLDPSLRPHIIIGSTPNLFAALGSYRLARYWNIPFILEIRDIWPQTLIDVGKISPHHLFVKILRTIEKYLYKKADHIITLLSGAEKHIAASTKHPPIITTIPNGFDFSLLEHHSSTPHTSENPFIITYAGSHGIANNLELLLEAAKIVFSYNPQIQFQFIGEGTAKPQLIRKAKREHIENVVFKNQVPKDHVFKTLSSSDAFIIAVKNLPLYRFGFSMNKIFDYMALGKPTIIATNIADNPITVSKAGVIASPDDAELLAKSILDFVALPKSHRLEMGNNAFQYVKKHHDIETLASRYLAVIEQTLQGHSPSASILKPLPQKLKSSQ